MIQLLTGALKRAIDDKQRIAIPKRFRDALCGPTPEGTEVKWTLYVTPGTDGSLALYGAPAFAALADRLAAGSPGAKDVRAFSRLFFARAQGVDVDKQGRIRLPSELAHSAGLAAEAMLIGVRDHLEIWNVERWQAYLTEQEKEYDALAERAFAGG